MKVLVSDALSEAGIDIFRNEAGIDVDVKTDLSPEDLKRVIPDYDALVIRSSTRVTADLLSAASRLKVVGRAGIGLDNVDIPAATKCGIVVMNTPTGNIVTTAEHTIAMMMSLSRNIPMGTATLKAGKWEKKSLQGTEIFQKTLGVIGFGKIGAIVADRAKNGLKMNVIVYDPFISGDIIEKNGYDSVTLEALFERSDYVTIHVPKSDKTANLIDKHAFQQMKDGVMLINCARGGIVNEADLNDALNSGKVAGAALDVFETEPPGECTLFDSNRVVCTPHLGASTQEAQINVAVAVAQQIVDYLKNNTIKNAVNMPGMAGEMMEKIRPYLTLANQMGKLQMQLVDGALQEVTIAYTGDFQRLDLAPITTSVQMGILKQLTSEPVNFVNAPVLMKQLGVKVVETISEAAEDYTHLITVSVRTASESRSIAGTLFGKTNLRIVKIDQFRLELIPQGHILLIYNRNQPGAIGATGMILGRHGINIGRMQVGQSDDEISNIIFMQTDAPASETVLAELRSAEMTKSVTPLEL